MCALGSAGSELMFSSCKDLSLELASVQNHSLPIYIGIVPYCDFFFFFWRSFLDQKTSVVNLSTAEVKGRGWSSWTEERKKANMCLLFFCWHVKLNKEHGPRLSQEQWLNHDRVPGIN